jgi:hypothetical protein
MPFELFRKIIDDLYKDKFTVGLFDFQGRGEPLMNKDVWKMVAYAREHFQDSKISITTNGNFDYNDYAVHAGISQLFVSVDGCFQDSYETYRKNGNIDKVFRFMGQFAKEKKIYSGDTELVWKYILFGHNDSDRELIATQKKAMELGVDSLFFEVTDFYHTCEPTRFLKKNELSNFPRIDTSGSSLRVLLPDANWIDGVTTRVFRGRLGFLKRQITKWIIRISGY